MALEIRGTFLFYTVQCVAVFSKGEAQILSEITEQKEYFFSYIVTKRNVITIQIPI